MTKRKNCKECKGECCKGMPGIAAPEDFGAPDVDVLKARLKSALHSGRWAIDWWEGGLGTERDRVLHVRPATKGDEGEVWDPSWGGVCTWLGPDGCTIFLSRPFGCRDLEPRDDGQCRNIVWTDMKEDASRAWLDYQDIVEEVGRCFDDEGPTDSVGAGLWSLGYV